MFKFSGGYIKFPIDLRAKVKKNKKIFKFLERYLIKKKDKIIYINFLRTLKNKIAPKCLFFGAILSIF